MQPGKWEDDSLGPGQAGAGILPRQIPGKAGRGSNLSGDLGALAKNTPGTYTGKGRVLGVRLLPFPL